MAVKICEANLCVVKENSPDNLSLEGTIPQENFQTTIVPHGLQIDFLMATNVYFVSSGTR
jgi:hypothetical protein